MQPITGFILQFSLLIVNVGPAASPSFLSGASVKPGIPVKPTSIFVFLTGITAESLGPTKPINVVLELAARKNPPVKLIRLDSCANTADDTIKKIKTTKNFFIAIGDLPLKQNT